MAYEFDDKTMYRGYAEGKELTVEELRKMVLNMKIATEDLYDGAVDYAKIKHASIGEVHIREASINNAMIQNLAVSRAKIENAAISAAKIEDLAVTGAKIANAAITSAKIEDLAVTAAKIEHGSITNLHFDRATGDKIQINDGDIVSLNVSKLTAGTLDTSKVTIQGDNGHLRMKGNRIQVFDGSSPQIERVSIGDINMDGTVYGLRVRGADGQTVLYDENGVYNEGITDGAITNPKIVNDAIDGRVIAADAVTAQHIVTGTITAESGLIADAAITAAMISHATIDNVHIRSGAITVDKLSVLARDLMNNPAKSNSLEGWTATEGTIAIHATTSWYDGAIRATSSANQTVMTDFIEVDPSKDYKIPAQVWNNGTAAGYTYFGIYAYDKNKTRIDVTPYTSAGFGTPTWNFYFAVSTTPVSWVTWEGYLLAHDSLTGQIGRGVTSSAKLPPETRYVRVRWLNYNQTANNTMYIFSPSMIQTDAGTIDANRLQANTVIANNIKFKGVLEGATGTFSGKVQASELVAENPNIEQEGTLALKLQLAQWQENLGQPFRKEGFINFNTLNNSLEIYKTDLNGNEVKMAGFRVNATTSDFLGNIQLDGHILSPTYMYIRSGGFVDIRSDYGVRVTKFDGSGRGDIEVGFVNAAAVDTTATNIYLRANGEARSTKVGTTGTYIPHRASSFPTGSLAEFKQDIVPHTGSFLDVILNTTLYDYRLKEEVKDGIDRVRTGLVIGQGYNTPAEVVDGDGVEQYMMNSYSWGAIQDLHKIILGLIARLDKLEAAKV